MTNEVVRVGGNVDSWCGKCKMMLAHTIEAMVGSKPARVSCNTCRSQHSYKSSAPGESSRQPKQVSGAAPATGTVRGRANRYQVLLKGKDMAQAKSYSIKDSYVAGDVLQHPNFGLGIAIVVKDGTKVEVLFENGPKVLVHGR